VLTHLIDADLRERHFGDFEGLTWSELELEHPAQAQAWKSRDPEWSPPSGESLNQFTTRIRDCVFRLGARHLNEHIAIVTHGGVLDVLYRLATGQESHAPRTWSLGNTHINRLLWSLGGLHLVGWGDCAHLDRVGETDPARAAQQEDYPLSH
jgi:probable phosphoglycerate mutase